MSINSKQNLSDDITIQDSIRSKIEEVRKLEKDIPAVLIIHDIRTWNVVHMSRRGLDFLDISLDEICSLGQEYHYKYFNPEDSTDYVPKILGLLERNNNDEIVSYFQQVRRSPDYEWSWFMSSTKINLWGEDGKPILTLTTAIPVDAQHHIATKAQRLLEENNFHRRHVSTFDQLTRQERQILKCLALGMNTAEIATKLHISESTASTHRRNIKTKLNAKSNYDISMFARAFDLI
jgi:DNA-binding CsgD family transcriptional regulator